MRPNIKNKKEVGDMEIKLFDIELANLTVGRSFRGIAVKNFKIKGRKVKAVMRFVVKDGTIVERKINYYPKKDLDKFELTFETMQFIDEVSRILEVRKG
jgi:hypothetical protein